MNDLLVKKDNVLITHQLSGYNKAQVKLFNYFVARAGTGENVFLSYKELFYAAGFGKGNRYTELVKLVDDLVHVRLRLPDGDGGYYSEPCFGRTHFQRLEDGTGINICFLPDCLPFLADPAEFTEYYFDDIVLLSSVYSIAIFELVMQYKNSNHKKRNITLSDFRDVLFIPETKYKQFKNLNSAVIQRSLKDIKMKIDMDISFTKEGQNLTFKVDKLPSKYLNKSLPCDFDFEAFQKILNFSKKQFLELIEICGLDLLNESLRYLKQVIIRAKAKKSETNEFALAKHVLVEDLHLIKEKSEKRKQGDALAKSKAQDEQAEADEQAAKAAREQKYQDFINSDDLENQLYIISENFNYDLVSCNLVEFKALDSDSMSLYNLSFNELDVLDMLDILSKPQNFKHVRFMSLRLALKTLILSCLI